MLIEQTLKAPFNPQGATSLKTAETDQYKTKILVFSIQYNSKNISISTQSEKYCIIIIINTRKKLKYPCGKNKQTKQIWNKKLSEANEAKSL